jgi:hypothetical protein
MPIPCDIWILPRHNSDRLGADWTEQDRCIASACFGAGVSLVKAVLETEGLYSKETLDSASVLLIEHWIILVF